ncbi:MAG: hypothetical protein E7478_03945 [Ruminococcaceae bacterium]|nr:hypothetical protein [Oscillospiraceae bacterium]
MKRRIFAAGAAAVFLLSGIGAAAYTNYCDSEAAVSLMSQHAPAIKDISTRFDALLGSIHAQSADNSDTRTTSSTASSAEESADSEEQASLQEQLAALYMERLALFDGYSAEIDALEYELAPMLIDYDMLLKQLKLLYDDYKACKNGYESCAALFKVGGCQLTDVEAAKKDTESKYYEIQALLYEISALKTEIEAITGETLTSDFDFSSAYLITDATKLVAEELTGIYGGASICMPEGSELNEIEIADISGQYNAAVKCYYDLGSAMREYIAAADALKKSEAELKLGTVTADTLAALKGEKTAAYMTASQAKADYAKSLLELDKASGGALTKGLSLSDGRAKAYKSAVSDKQSGSGLWVMSRTATGNVYSVAALPYGVYVREKDVVSWTMTYNNRMISTGGTGGACSVIQYVDECDYAEITFYVNNIPAGTYKVDVFAPFGEFID